MSKKNSHQPKIIFDTRLGPKACSIDGQLYEKGMEPKCKLGNSHRVRREPAPSGEDTIIYCENCHKFRMEHHHPRTTSRGRGKR